VREQWNLLQAAFRRNLRGQCGMHVVGHASDGDERRHTLQKADTCPANVEPESCTNCAIQVSR
jgi:hypothetical protein